MSLNSPRAWTEQPLRFFQHLLRETDAAGTSARQLVDEITSVGANACIVMGGGFSAWYPTASESQTINPHIESDFLGDFLAIAKKSGIRTLVRMDISKGREGMETSHPDWVVRKQEGSVNSVWAMPQICSTGPFWQEEVFTILGEILDRYPSADGFFFNYLHVPRCHCARCDIMVKAATGNAVPPEGVRDAGYESWRQEFLADYMGKVRSFIHARNPAAALVPYHHVHDGWNIRRMADISDIIGSQVSNPVIPNPIDPQPIWNLWAAEEALTARSLKPDCSPLLIQTTSEVFASRQSSMPDARLVHNLMQAAAHGASTAPAVNGLLAQPDARFVPALRELGAYLARNARWYEELSSLARIVVIRSEDSRLWGADAGMMAGAADGSGHVAEFRGICELLSDLRYPFDIVVSPGLTEEQLSRFELVVLPSVSSLSDVDADAIDAYVAKGGRILATADLASCDGNGLARSTAALHSLPGLPGQPRSVVGSYLAVVRPGIAAKVDYIPYIPVSDLFWSPFGLGQTQDDLRLVGPFANNAPEFTVVEGQGKEPGLIERQVGAGSACWLPWRIGALYNRFSMPEYQRLFASVLETRVGQAPVSTSSSNAVESILYARPAGMILHLLNGAARCSKTLVELTPLAGFDVAIETTANLAVSLRDSKKLPIKRQGNIIVIHVDRLDDFAAIALVQDEAGWNTP